MCYYRLQLFVEKHVVGFKELVSLYFERSNAVQTFWNFQVTIILALLAFFGTTTMTSKKLVLAGVLSFAYLVFACVNVIAVAEVTKVRGVTKGLIDQWSNPGAQVPDMQTHHIVEQIKGIPQPPSVLQVVAMHITGDFYLLWRGSGS